MSTFTDGWNGPENSGGLNYALFRRYLDDLKTELATLAAKLPDGQFNASSTIRAELTRIAGLIPPLETRINALSTSINTGTLNVGGALSVTSGLVNIATSLKALDIDVKNISAGPSLFFDKYYSVNIGVGSGTYYDYYVLGELVRVIDTSTNQPTITLPATLYVYNNADPKVSAVIYATEGGLAVLHCGRDFANPPVSGAPPPLVRYAIIRTGSSDSNFHYYACMVLYKQNDTGQKVQLANTALRVAMINAKPVTQAISGPGVLANQWSLVSTTRESDFLATHLSIADLDVSNMRANSISVSGASTLRGATTVGAPGAPTSLTVYGSETVSGNQQVSGTSILQGATTINTSLTVNGPETVNGNQQVTGNQNIGGTTTTKGLTVNGPETVNGNLVVTGTSELRGATTVGTASVPSSLVVRGPETVYGVQTVNGNQTVTGNGTVIGNQSVTGSQTIGVDQTVNRNQLVKGNQDVNGTTTTKELEVNGPAIIDTTLTAYSVVAEATVNSPILMYQSVPMVSIDSQQITVGSSSRHLELVSKNRPTVRDGAVLQDIAYRSDLVNSIVYKGLYLLYSEGAPTYTGQIQINDDSTPKYYTLQDGDKCLAFTNGPARPDGVTEFQTAQVYTYVKATGKWTTTSAAIIPHPAHGQTYQWHITYLKQDNDAYFHQAEVLWNPDNAPGEIASYINLPLEDYYTKEQIEKLVTMFYDLSTRQADWFATNKISTDDWRHNGIDNPAYIRNKPLTGMSVLDGGPFIKDPPLDYPQWIVDGGEFDILGTSRGTVETYDDLPTTAATGWVVNDYIYVRQDKHNLFSSSRYKINAIATTAPYLIDWQLDRVVNDIGNIRQDVIFKVWSGKKVDLPPSASGTKFSLKWCYNTRELFIDQYGEPDDGTFVNGNYRISPATFTAINNVTIAQGTDKDTVDNRVLSAVQSFAMHNPSGTPSSLNLKLLATGDKRISFDTITHPTADTWVLPVAVYTADFMRMLTPSSVAKQEVSFANNSLTIQWQTNTYNTMYVTDSKTENVTFLPGNGIQLVYDGTTPAAKKLTVQLETSTQNALDATPVLQAATSTVSAAAGFSFGVSGNFLRTQTTAFAKEITINVGDGLVITPTDPQVDPNKPIGTINLSPDFTTAVNRNVVLSSVYTSDTTSAKITTVENKLYNQQGPDITKSLSIKVDSTLKMLDTGSTTLDKITTLGFSDATIASLETPVLLSISATDAKITVNKGQIYGSYTPAAMTYDIVAGTGLAVAAVKTDEDTVVTIGLDTATIASLESTMITDASITDAKVTLTKSQIYGTPTPVVMTYDIVAGTGLAVAAAKTDEDTVVTVGLATATATSLETPVIVGISATDAKLTVNKDRIYGTSDPVAMTYDIVAGDGAAVSAVKTDEDTVVTVGLDPDVLAQDYIDDVAPSFATGKLTLDVQQRTIGDATVTSKRKVSLVAGVNMEIVEGGTDNDKTYTLNTPSTTIPGYAAGNQLYPDDHPLITFDYEATVWNRICSMHIHAYNQELGGRFTGSTSTMTLPVSLRPMIPMKVGYTDVEQDGGHQEVTINPDGTITFNLCTVYEIDAVIMYFVS
jgi:hypothetical protein